MAQLEMKYVFIIFCLSIAHLALGQPVSASEQAAFVLNVLNSKTGQFIPGLKIYLVDENHVPYTIKSADFNVRSDSMMSVMIR